MKFSKDTMNKMAKTIRASLKKNNTLPSFVSAKDMDGKKHDLSKKQYAGLFEAQYVFWKNNNRQPNYTSLVSTANNPLVLLTQHYKMSCCPTSLAMASMMLYNYKTEKQCIKALGTDVKVKGTAPSQLINGAKNVGMKVTVIPRNKDSVKNSLKLNRPVIAHIDTSKAKCLGFTSQYGHYVLIGAVSGDYYTVYCPTKGKHKCKSSVLDKAMLKGRDLKYYSVGLA